MCGVPIFCRFGDYNHFTPVAMKVINDLSADKYTDLYDLSGRLDFWSFINIYPSYNIYYLVFIMV